MHMKKLSLYTLFVTVSAAFGFAATPAAFAQGTPDGETPANEGVCDDLMFATPGLYGLCVAFCEAQDCEPDFSLDDPFEQCTPSSPMVLEAYDRRKGEGDPEMPCVQQTGCPCWSTEELADFPFPSDIDGRPTCLHQDGMFFFDLWAVLSQRGAPFIELATFGLDDNENPVPPACRLDQRFVEPFVSREFLITPDEYAICTADVIDSGRERGFDCWPEP